MAPRFPRFARNWLNWSANCSPIRNLGGTAKEKLDELRGEWPILQPAVEAFSADSEPATWKVFDDLEECLPAAQSDKVKDLI